jgi:peptide/nickel transport system substrate-binding protein
MRIVKLTGMATALVALLVAACGNASSGATGQTAVEGGSLVFRVAGDWKNFDVQLSTDSQSQLAVVMGYSTLLYQDNQGKLQGYMAKSWKVTPNSVTFQLKQGITCADGTPVTPSVVKDSFQLFIDRKAPYLGILYGPGPYSASADDSAGTFTFTTGGPFSELIYSFSQVFPSSLSSVICPAGVAAVRKDPTALQTKIYGSGPYTLVDAVHGDHMTWKLRPEFNWGPLGTTAKTLGIADKVTLQLITNDTTAANSLLTGAIDTAVGQGSGAIQGPDVDRLLKDPSIRHFEQPQYATHFLVFNQTPGHPGTELAVRQALMTAIDRKSYMQGESNGHARLTPTIVTQDVQCFDPSVASLVPTPSVDAAKKVLTDAGWTLSGGKMTKSGRTLRVVFSTPINYNAGPDYITQQWTQVGVDVVLQNVDFATYAANALGGKFDASIFQTNLPAPVMGPIATRMIGQPPPIGSNNTRVIDPVIDSEVAAARSATGAEVCQHWSNFQKQLWKNWDAEGLDAPFTENFTKKFDMSLGTIPMMLRRVK